MGQTMNITLSGTILSSKTLQELDVAEERCLRRHVDDYSYLLLSLMMYAIVTWCYQRAARSTTDSLPPTRCHYNDIEIINMFVSLNEIDVFLTTSTSSDVIHDFSPNNLDDQCFLTASPSFLGTRPYDQPTRQVWLAGSHATGNQ